MTRLLLVAETAMFLSAILAGCATVTVPDYAGGSWGRPEPSAAITPGNPNDKADLVRENTELRDRLAWVESRNRSLSRKYNDLADDMAKAREKTSQYAADRDRYKAAANGGAHE
jgi:hypothetical protein